MTLGRKFILLSLVLTATFAGFGTITLLNLRTLLLGSRSAAAEYEAGDRAQALTNQVTWLRDALRGSAGAGGGATYRDPRFFDPIRTEVTSISALLTTSTRLDTGDASRELQLAALLPQQLATAETLAASSTATPAAVASQLDLTLQTLGIIMQLGPSAARHHVTSSTSRLVSMLEWSVLWLLVVLVTSALIHYRQYRALIRPLTSLRDQMRTSAAREYQPLPDSSSADPEYRELAQHYNTLARELAYLYRDLEKKIVARSRELVRSERLASVGYLAAGVAHEINNPLSVIAGYAELSSNALNRMLESDASTSSDDASAQHEANALAEALEAQRVIRDESFRCKEITSRLLSLARGGSSERTVIDLPELARQVVTLTHGLRQFRDRHISIQIDETLSPGLYVHANPTELKQVLLNLTVNALEAVSPANGEVRVHVSRQHNEAQIAVIDNGKGMSSDMVEQVFEPFFTAKRGSGEPGTGLGLSITHAIVESHHGSISAHSKGPGLGSTFIVRLPLARLTIQSLTAS